MGGDAHCGTGMTGSELRSCWKGRCNMVSDQLQHGYDQTVNVHGTLNTYDNFMLAPKDTFTIYDRHWIIVSSCSVGPFHPTHLAGFQMSAGVPTPSTWLEIGVAGATETTPNPFHTTR